MRTSILVIVTALALAGCGNSAEEADEPRVAEGAIPVESDGGIGDGAGPPDSPPAPESSGAPADPGDRIPKAMIGRWGMTANDCDPSRSDNKGLMVVTGDTLKFYESVARLDDIQEQTDDNIRASFDFTGEGMKWTRDILLNVEDNGEKLVRTERSADGPGSGGPFTYNRCDA